MTRTSHSETDPAAEYLMDRFDAILSFEKAVGMVVFGYSVPTSVARWWHQEEWDCLTQYPRYPELLDACVRLESVIGTEDSYWKDPWSES